MCDVVFGTRRWRANFSENLFFLPTYGSRHSRMDQVNFVEDYLGSLYHFKYFKGCLPQILLGPFLNTLSYIKLHLTVSLFFFFPGEGLLNGLKWGICAILSLLTLPCLMQNVFQVFLVWSNYFLPWKSLLIQPLAQRLVSLII